MRRWLKRAVWAALGGWALLMLFAHPYFAIQRPSGAGVLVAEGWMHHAGLKEAANLYLQKGYGHMYITGNLRPFVYYLRQDEGVEVRLDTPVDGGIALRMDGLPGSRWVLVADGDTVLTGEIGADGKDHRLMLERPAGTLRIMDRSGGSPGPDVPLLFIGRLAINGTNAHALPGTIARSQADGTVLPGWPTQAEEAMERLAGHGVPMEQMTAVPNMATRDRTRGSAEAFMDVARSKGIERYDVATLGVHARRTYNSHVRANGSAEGVGVVSLYDPWCARWTWWMNYYGWYQVLKELAALPRTWWGGADGA